MTRTEKLQALIKHGNPEQIPFFRPMLMHFAARFINKTYSDFATDYKVLVESNLACMDAFDMDAVGLISDPYCEAAAFGAEVSFPEDSVPVCENPIIHSHEDLKNLHIPEVDDCERTLFRIRGAEEFSRILKGETPVIGWIQGPMAEACMLVDVSEMLLNLFTDDHFTKVLLEKTTQFAIQFAEAQIDAGCHVIGIGDAICSQISAELFIKYEKQPLREIIQFIHSKGALVKLHICGDITHHLPAIRDLEPDIVDLDWQVDMDEAYTLLGDDIVRGGNMNSVDILQKKPQEIYSRTRERCDLERNKKYMLAGGCEIIVNTPHENLLAMTEAGKSVNQ